jgi:hypothetical protein
VTDQIAKANANASRAFFVQMLTRDIALEDCVLDLLDNSVDGAWRSLGHTAPSVQDQSIDLSPFSIEIVANEKLFSVKDNCGGMTQVRAEKYAFTFGRQYRIKEVEIDGLPKEQPLGALDGKDAQEDRAEAAGEADYRIGVYGIGMKRAIFKIGASIQIKSTYTHDGIRQAFEVPIDVPTWMREKNTDWSFAIFTAEAAPEDGIIIEVRNLSRQTVASFGSDAFLQNLRRVIERDYSLHLSRGLRVSLNGDPLEPWQITMLEGGDFAAVNKSWDVHFEEGSVHVELLAGGGDRPPDDEFPDEDDKGEQRFGWYVACNGRIVLAGDKTALSVWASDDFPMWHRQYRGFLGIILFTSENTELLPLTTTKRSVDVSSEVFRQAKPAMREATRAWINYTNARKQAREAAKAKEAEAKAVSIFRVPTRAAISTPTFAPTTTRVRTSSIQFSEPVAKIRKLGAAFGSVNMPASQVGSRSFDYAYEDLVNDD